MLDGHEWQFWNATLTTIELAVSSLFFSFLIGLLGAFAKLSKLRWLRAIAGIYTTLIRGIPDLVLMFLIFYSAQDGLNRITDALGQSQWEIDRFTAGVAVLSFIYGAYFTETFRGAFLAIPPGQWEAALAFGLGARDIFVRILFPQLMRFALPGVNNNWQVILKATALVSLLGLNELVRTAQDASVASRARGMDKAFFFLIAVGVLYLLLTAASSAVFRILERRFASGFQPIRP